MNMNWDHEPLMGNKLRGLPSATTGQRLMERAGARGLPVSLFFQVGNTSRCDIRSPKTGDSWVIFHRRYGRV